MDGIAPRDTTVERGDLRSPLHVSAPGRAQAVKRRPKVANNRHIAWSGPLSARFVGFAPTPDRQGVQAGCRRQLIVQPPTLVRGVDESLPDCIDLPGSDVAGHLDKRIGDLPGVFRARDRL